MEILFWLNSLSTPVFIVVIVAGTLSLILVQTLLAMIIVKLLTNNDKTKQTLKEEKNPDVTLLQKSDITSQHQELKF